MSKEEKEAARLHLDTTRLVLGEEHTRQIGFRCRECNSSKTVYFITKRMYGIFPEGAYCYACLLKLVRLSRAIPFPIETWLLDSLKRDLGVPISEAPYMKIFYKDKGG